MDLDCYYFFFSTPFIRHNELQLTFLSLEEHGRRRIMKKEKGQSFSERWFLLGVTDEKQRGFGFDFSFRRFWDAEFVCIETRVVNGSINGSRTRH